MVTSGRLRGPWGPGSSSRIGPSANAQWSDARARDDLQPWERQTRRVSLARTLSVRSAADPHPPQWLTLNRSGRCEPRSRAWRAVRPRR